MDLQWLLPEQIQQVLRLCDLSSIQDITFAASLLEMNNWNLQLALNQAVGNKDHIEKTEIQNSNHKNQNNHIVNKEQILSNKIPFVDEQFELDQQSYHQLGINGLTQPTKKEQHTFAFTNIRHQQNKEYQMMQHNQKAKQIEEEEWNSYAQLKEKQFQQDKKLFENHQVTNPIQIKFRLPQKIEFYTFDKSETVKKVYQYVNGHLRSGLENQYSQFQLCQTFQSKNLKEMFDQTLHQVFGDSSGEVIIVKEI